VQKSQEEIASYLRMTGMTIAGRGWIWGLLEEGVREMRSEMLIGLCHKGP
jgi:hypothetical protein